jgi:hypothetical protein
MVGRALSLPEDRPKYRATKKEQVYAYRKFLFPIGASTTVKPMGESVQSPDSGPDMILADGHDNGWIVLLVKMSAASWMSKVLIDDNI